MAQTDCLCRFNLTFDVIIRGIDAQANVTSKI